MQALNDISFGRFRLDLVNECLRQGTKMISLRPKAFAVLRLLIENSGSLVTKQRVLDAVWPGTFVGDAVLKDNIRQLREALDDDAACPTYIETAHRRGYRFIGKLSGEEPATQKSSRSSDPDSIAVAGNPIGALGRNTELVMLNGFLSQASAGERQVVFITGEPGIGKTTLVNALRDFEPLRVVV